LKHLHSQVVVASVKTSSAIAEMAAQCCTSRIVKRWGWVTFHETFAEKGASAVSYVIVAKTFQLHFRRRHYGM